MGRGQSRPRGCRRPGGLEAPSNRICALSPGQHTRLVNCINAFVLGELLLRMKLTKGATSQDKADIKPFKPHDSQVTPASYSSSSPSPRPQTTSRYPTPGTKCGPGHPGHPAPAAVLSPLSLDLWYELSQNQLWRGESLHERSFACFIFSLDWFRCYHFDKLL